MAATCPERDREMQRTNKQHERLIARDKTVGERDVRKQPERERERKMSGEREGERGRLTEGSREIESEIERGTDFLIGRQL